MSKKVVKTKFKFEFSFKAVYPMRDKELKAICGYYSAFFLYLSVVQELNVEYGISYFHRDEYDELNDLEIPCLYYLLQGSESSKTISLLSSLFSNLADLINFQELGVIASLEMLE